MLIELLARKRKELDAEQKSVDAMLRECARDHVTPAKDYWYRLESLRQQVDIYERAIKEGVE